MYEEEYLDDNNERSALLSTITATGEGSSSYGTSRAITVSGDDEDEDESSLFAETVSLSSSHEDNDDDENDEDARGRTSSRNPDAGATGINDHNPDTENSDDGSESGDASERSGAIGTLTRRLRCLFSTITWPIVPLGTIVALALIWVLYAASSLDLRRSCSHPLHWYAMVSLVLVAYIPYHGLARSHLFQYSRERDGPIRPARVRMYDQFFHTICLLYVYTGVTLIQTCRDDAITDENLAELLEKYDLESIPPDAPRNTCAATCPNLYQAVSVYVATLEMFTFALILPLLFLPCIYLWFLRRATAEAEAFAQLQDRLQEEEALLNNGGITAGEILDGLENVKLVSRPSATGSGEPQVWLLPSSDNSSTIGCCSDVKECCICMNDFGIQNEQGGDVESGFQNQSVQQVRDSEVDNSSDAASTTSTSTERTDMKAHSIVRTRCGHIFHKEVSSWHEASRFNYDVPYSQFFSSTPFFFQCLAGWVGGRWSANPQNEDTNEEATQQERRRRRARQTCCPLCREDMRPRTSGGS